MDFALNNLKGRKVRWCKCEKKWVSEAQHKYHVNCKCGHGQEDEYWADKYYRNQEYWNRVWEKEQQALNDNIDYWIRKQREEQRALEANIDYWANL